MHARTLTPLCVASFLSCLILAGQAADWAQWRGPKRDGHSGESLQLASLSGELKPAWKESIGTGFSSPVVADDSLYYADEQNGREVLHRVEAGSGKEIWSVSIAEAAGDEWGSGPRSTPFLDGDRIYFQSINGEFRCLNAVDGKVRWGVSFKDHGAPFLGGKAREGTASRRGNNGCGIVHENYVYVPVGAKGASIICFDKLTGKLIWKALDDEAAYSSFIIAALAGTTQLVAFTADALVGMDLQTGKQLWRVPFKTGAKRHAATPVINGDTVTVCSQTIGLVCTKIERQGDAFVPRELWANKPLKINLATPVLVDGHFYSFGATRSKSYACVDAASGVTKWTQGGFGLNDQGDYASTIVVGKSLLVLTYDGMLSLLSATPDKFTELGHVQVCGKTWSHPALANGRLYVRDNRELQCFVLASKSLTANR